MDSFSGSKDSIWWEWHAASETVFMIIASCDPDDGKVKHHLEESEPVPFICGSPGCWWCCAFSPGQPTLAVAESGQFGKGFKEKGHGYMNVALGHRLRKIFRRYWNDC